MAPTTSRHEQRNLACELIKRKLRTPIVHLHTRLPLADIRGWHREIHGQSPSSGLLPSMSTLLPNRSSQIHVSLFAAIYLRLGGDRVLQEIDIRALVEAWDLFDALTANVDRKRPADITDAWVIARDLRAGSAQMHRCAKCFSPYLVADDCSAPVVPNVPRHPAVGQRKGFKGLMPQWKPPDGVA